MSSDLAHDWTLSSSPTVREVPGSFRVWAPAASRVRVAWRIAEAPIGGAGLSAAPGDGSEGNGSEPLGADASTRRAAGDYLESPLQESDLAVAGFTVDELTRTNGGWWSLVNLPKPLNPESLGSATTPSELDYGFLIDNNDTLLPDPRAYRSPRGPHGPSAVTLGATAGGQPAASVPPRPTSLSDGAAIYELHLGTFTPEGTLSSAAAKLDHLVDLGVGWVELLPVNAFAGLHNWGYDGVQWFAVAQPYGGQGAYREFVTTAHAHGLGVIQDVVFNHLGPSGNYLPLFGPYLHSAASNPWGDSVNLDGADSDEVRAYILDVLTHFAVDLGVDGFRLDAVHALVDSRATHILEDMSALCARLSERVGRRIVLIAESDRNDPATIAPRRAPGAAAGGLGLDGQWSDDYHHALHVALTGETSGYYSDFAAPDAVAKVYDSGFFHDGTFSSFRGRFHGRALDPVANSPEQLVVSLQNHDQVGNRAAGDRLPAQTGALHTNTGGGSDTDPQAAPVSVKDNTAVANLAVGAFMLLLGPNTPMLFMGEEWAASTPWQFFTDHREDWLREAVSKGRRSEFAEMGWDLESVPDPQDPQTFSRSKLDWAEAAQPPHAAMLALYTALGALRRKRHEFRGTTFADVSVERSGAAIRWQIGPSLVMFSHPATPGAEQSDATFTLPSDARQILDVADYVDAAPRATLNDNRTTLTLPPGSAIALTL